MDEPKGFRTLPRFLDGREPDEETYFAYSATLRIMGVLPDLQLITNTLGLTPTQALRKGQRVGPRSAPLEHDCWHYRPDVPESEPLEVHINALWSAVKDHRDFIAAGGLGPLIGDGKLNYQPECVLEAYYAYALTKAVTLTADYQLITNPAYNADRGPVSVFSGRLHGEF